MTRAPRHVPRSPTEELLDPTWNEGIMMTMDDPIPLTVDRCRTSFISSSSDFSVD
jgi:hypothetical protein